MGLKSFFAKLLGKTDDVAGIAKHGDDVLDVARYGDDMAGLVADNAGRAVMSPELLSDDFLDAVDDFAYHTPSYADTVDDFASIGQTPSSHILGSNPNAIINRQPGSNIGHSWVTIDSDLDIPTGKYVPGFPTGTSDYGLGWEDNIQLQPYLKVHHPEYTPPQLMGSNSFKDLVKRIRDYRAPYSGNDLPF